MTVAAVNSASGLDLRLKPEHATAIALDFDGVCKLFTEHKHQIMSTLLFLHFPEFQKVPLDEYRKAYGHINFRSKDYAGKARFLCVNALADFIATEKGCKCRLSDLDNAIKSLLAQGSKVNAMTLKGFLDGNADVARALSWSEEVDSRLAQLTGIGLTPGIKERILDAFEQDADFYLVSTATESSIRASMEREGVMFIKRYFGQETAGKAEALSVLANAGYENVFMFGDSIEDSRASKTAMAHVPKGVNLVFIPVIPGSERQSFEKGEAIIKAVASNAHDEGRRLAAQQEKAFEGNEAGCQWGCR